MPHLTGYVQSLGIFAEEAVEVGLGKPSGADPLIEGKFSVSSGGGTYAPDGTKRPGPVEKVKTTTSTQTGQRPRHLAPSILIPSCTFSQGSRSHRCGLDPTPALTST